MGTFLNTKHYNTIHYGITCVDMGNASLCSLIGLQSSYWMNNLDTLRINAWQHAYVKITKHNNSPS